MTEQELQDLAKDLQAQMEELLGQMEAVRQALAEVQESELVPQ